MCSLGGRREWVAGGVVVVMCVCTVRRDWGESCLGGGGGL